MKKPGIILFNILLFSNAAFSQQNYVVISNTGLKLRDAPDRNSRVLVVAPFGARVQVLCLPKNEGHTVEFDPPARRDTIGHLFPIGYDNRSSPHIGYWWNVRYAGKTGYMFSGFLADSAMLNSGYRELNDQFRLRAAGGNIGASNDPEFDQDWFWYGVFPTADGQFSLKKVKLRYAVADYTDADGSYDLYAKEVLTQTDPPERPVWIIGTRKPWKARTAIDGFDVFSAPLVQYLENGTGLNHAFLKKYLIEVEEKTITREGRFEQKITQLFMTGKNGQRQAVEPLVFDSGYALYPNALAWAGDLDGDGKPDYIFQAYGEIGYYILYLSGQAGKGEVARPVAVLWNWYTC